MDELTDNQAEAIAIPKQRSSSINASSTMLPTQTVLSSKSQEQFKSENQSVEDFFFNSQHSSPQTRGILSRTVSHSGVQTPAPTLPASDLLMTAVSSSTHSNIGNTGMQSTTTSMSSSPELLRTSSAASIFIPKSRVSNLSPSHSVVQMKRDAATPGLAGVKRVPYKRSALKFSTRDDVDDEEDDNEDSNGVDDDEDEAVIENENANDDIDDGYDAQQSYRIPKFGGFSKKKMPPTSKSSELFANAPFQVVEFAKGNGGLKNAIKSSLEDGIVKDYTWLGTIGIPTDALDDKTKLKITSKLKDEYHSESVLPSDLTFQGHYKNFCKQILWPTLHYQIPDNPNSKAFEDHSWEYYRSLNQLFADKIVQIYKEDDIIWIHDYHLLLVPEMVRSKLPNAKIGFFMHVSFPSSEVFRCFAQREALLQGLLGSNAISFQTTEYVRHFLQTCNKLLLADVSHDELRYNGYTVKVRAQPVGIDAHKLRKQIATDLVTSWRELIKQRWGDKKIIVGRDKFDRIRGVKEKLLAYEMFLQNNPEYLETTVLIQICLKSSTVENALESEIMSVVDRINSLSPNISTTQPVVFIHQDIDFVQYLALIAEADTFIVSSMREGMNLTCHEFIVATAEKKSPLILSEFTGSAAVFKKGALLINPWDIKQVSQAYKTALAMTPGEKEKNWRLLYDVVSHQDCDYWVEASLKFIKDSWQEQHEKERYSALNVKDFSLKYQTSKNRLFVLLLSRMPVEREMAILSDLSTDNQVYVLSGYKRVDLERVFRRLPNVGLIAEGGSFLKISNTSNWISFASEDIESLLQSTAVVAESFAERLPGARVEQGESILAFRTEQVQDKEREAATIGDLITHVNSSSKKIHATVVDNTVYVLPSDAAVKAVKFLVKYMTTTGTVGNDISLAQPTSPSSAPSVANVDPMEPKQLDFVCIGGRSNDLFEPVLGYGNEISAENEAKNVFTISFDGDATNAKERVEGLNELYSILKKLI